MKKISLYLIAYLIMIVLLTVPTLMVIGFEKQVFVEDMAFWRDSNEIAYSLYGPKVIGQVFVPNFDNLGRICLPLRASRDNFLADINLYVKSLPGDKAILRKARTSIMLQQGKANVAFNFEPIAKSKGKRIYFYITSPSSRNTEPIYAFYSTKIATQTKTGGSVVIGGIPKKGNLLFKSFSRFDFRLQLVWDGFLKRLGQDKVFTAFYFILLFFCSCIIGFLAMPWRRGSK
jgi:hypothetical protein